MKKIFVLSLLFISLSISAQTVKLKITYKDYPVTDSDISIKLGDATIGTGRTNDNGEVSVNCNNLITKSIDVYGSKQTSNTTKKWDVKGYVVLDNNNYFHLKMEILAKEMADASGGFMSENSVAAMWGLTASGKNDSTNNNSNSSTNNSSNNTNSSSNNSNTSNSSTDDKDEPIDLNQMREENMLAYKQNLEAEIMRYERKIKRDQKDIDEAKFEGKTQSEIRRLEIEKEIDVLTKEKKEIQLKETNAKIAKSELPFDERKRNDTRKDQIKDQISSLKDESKKLKKQGDSPKENHSSDIKSDVDSNTKSPEADKTTKENSKYSDEALKNKSKLALKKDLTEFKVDLKGKEFSLKTKSGIMAQDKIERLKVEIAELEVLIQKYENRLKELENEKE